MTRIGVFGSSFNPPTLGHSVLLAEAAWRLDLERIIVVPTGEAWHKAVDVTAPSGEQRKRLAEAAFCGESSIEISGAEVSREGPSYTCETLEEIDSTFPDSQIYFLAGSDAALGIGKWHRREKVLDLTRFAVAPRPGTTRAAVADAFESLGAGDRVEFFEMPEIAVSSTLVRERIALKQPWKHLVPHEVAEMIDNEDLYGINQ